MTPVFLKPYSSNLSHDIGDPRDHQDQKKEQHLQLSLSLHNEGSSSSSCLAVSPVSTFLGSDTRQDQRTGVFQINEQRDHKDVGVDLVKTKYEDNGGSAKYWMSSKMRILHKMANPETPAESDLAASGGQNNVTHTRNQNQNDYVNNNNVDNSNKGMLVENAERNNNNKQITFSFSRTNSNTTALRVCSDCNTTSTPLWRSGPRGPKSLCNACGIRQRKARRAMAEAALAGGGGDSEAATVAKKSSVFNYNKAHSIKEKKTHHHYKTKLKLRIVDATPKTTRNNKLCFRDLSFALNDNRSVFPQDVAEAAMLLMELSCHGLVN